MGTTDKIMKHFNRGYIKTAFLLLSMCLMGSLAQAQTLGSAYLPMEEGSENKVKIEKGVALKKAIDKLEKQFNVVFLYRTDALAGKKVTEAIVLPANIEKAITAALKDQNLEYKYLNPKTYGIYPSDSSPQKEQAAAPMQEEITGSVTDAQTGEPLPGVNILVKGTNTGTSTDANGDFELMVESLQDTLVVTFVGYQRQEVPINGRSEVSVQLTPEAIMGEEMVVVGYGEQKKKNLVGSIASMDIKDITTRPSAGIGKSLQGSIPGLNISKSTSGGDPSQSPEINIRGFNSINGGKPLVLVDGIVGNLRHVNPNDIESITVLKDSEAAAIYGARGSFGVVLIETKSGKEGKFEIEYSNNISLSTSTVRTDFVTDPYTYVKTINDAIHAWNNGIYLDYNDEDMEILKKVGMGKISPYNEKQSDGTYKFYNKTDWYHTIYKKWIPSHHHNISISGGSKKINGRLSGRIYNSDKEQKIQNPQTSRYNLNLNIRFRPYEWLEITGINKLSRYFNEVYGGDANGWYGNYGFRQYHDLFVNYPKEIDGYFPDIGRAGNGGTGILGPLYDGGNSWRIWQQDSKTNTLKAKLTPIKQLEINFDYSYQIKQYDRKYRLAEFDYLKGDELELTTAGQNRLNEGRWKNKYQAINIYGEYSRDILNKHHISLMVGYNQEQFDRDRINAVMDNIMSREKSNLNLGTEMHDMSGSAANWAIEGFFGRFKYDYDEKYLLEINSRYDGSSRFPSDTRWGFFPSFALGWQVDKEKFWGPTLKNIISFLKLRGSYGMLGNQNVPNNTFRELLGTGKTSSWLIDGEQINYVRVPSPLPETTSWEKVYSINLGADLGFLENRITASFEWYQRTTTDMYLKGKPLPPTFGASEPKKNYASLRNRGIEISLGYSDSFELFGSELSFTVDANVSNSVGKITKFDNPKGLLSTFYEGQTIGEIWGYHIDGQFQTDEEAAEFQSQYDDDIGNNLSKVYENTFIYTTNKEWQRLKAGDIKYVDLNGDGKIDNGHNTLENHGDLKKIGNAMPKFPFGFNISAEWKNFDLSIVGQGIGKQDWYPSGTIYWGMFNRPYTNFIRKDLLSHTWDPDASDNSGNYYPQRERAYIAYGGNRSLYNYNDYYLTNIGYLRIKNLTIGYTLPQKITEKAAIKKLRVYFSGENMFTWRFGNLSKYIDPELVGSEVSYSNPNSAVKRVPHDIERYSIYKTFSLGIVLNI